MYEKERDEDSMCVCIRKSVCVRERKSDITYFTSKLLSEHETYCRAVPDMHHAIDKKRKLQKLKNQFV